MVLKIKESEKNNFEETIRKMETLINIWSDKKLSLKGEVTILKSFIISHVFYLLSVLFVPDSTLQKIDRGLLGCCSILKNIKPIGDTKILNEHIL